MTWRSSGPTTARRSRSCVLTRLAGVPTRRGQRPHRRAGARGVGAPAVTTIERVEVERLSLPLHTPFVTALRRATTVETVVVRVTDSDGRVGLGEAPENWQVLGSSVAGSRGLPRGAAARRRAGPARATRPRPGRSSTAPWPGNSAAKAALDCALHDLGGAAVPARADAGHRPGRRAGRDRRGGAGAGGRGVPDPQAQGRHRRRHRRRPGAGRARGRGPGRRPAGRRQHGLGLLRGGRASSVRSRTPAWASQLVEQPVGRRDLAGLAHVRRHVETPVMADESVFDLDDLVDAAPPRRGRPGQRQDRQGRRPHPGPRAGPGGAGPRRSASRSAACSSRRSGSSAAARAGGAGRLRRGSRPRRRLVAGDGAPYADRVAYADGRVVVGSGWLDEGHARGRCAPRARRGFRAGHRRWWSARRSSSSSSGPEWTRVLAPEQPTHLDPAGYPGWVRTRRAAADDPLAVARGFLGTPYVWGGLGRDGIDCSGLVHLSFRAIGVRVPRDAADQAAAAAPVSRPAPRRPLFFGRPGEPVSHVGFVTEHGPAARQPRRAESSRSRCPRTARARCSAPAGSARDDLRQRRRLAPGRRPARARRGGAAGPRRAAGAGATCPRCPAEARRPA